MAARSLAVCGEASRSVHQDVMAPQDLLAFWIGSF
jgi:hypothetical protein